MSIGLPTSDRDGDDAAGLTLEPLSSALGTKLTGVVSSASFSRAFGPFVHRALLAHQLVLVRGLELDAASFRRIAVLLGPLRRVPYGMQSEPGMSDVQRLTNLDAAGRPTGINPDPYSLHWHSDGSATRIPSRYTLLYAVRVPDRGADTSFANMYAACAALAPERRRALAGRCAIHDPDTARYFRRGAAVVPPGMSLAGAFRKRVRFVRRLFSAELTRHPVIRSHEETGREALYLGDHAWRVTGCWWPAGIRLVDELNTFATANPEWIYTHRWNEGDLVIWDNRCLLHRGSQYDAAAEKRVMLRAVVQSMDAPEGTPA